MRNRRITLRFSETEEAKVVAFAKAERLTKSEAVRRLVLWNRAPGFVLSDPISDRSQDLSDAK